MIGRQDAKSPDSISDSEANGETLWINESRILPPLGSSSNNIDIYSILEYDKTWNIMSKEWTVPLSPQQRPKKKERTNLFPEPIEEVSMETVDYIMANKKALISLAAWPSSPQVKIAGKMIRKQTMK